MRGGARNYEIRPCPGGSGLSERGRNVLFFFCSPVRDRGFGSPSIVVLATAVTTIIAFSKCFPNLPFPIHPALLLIASVPGVCLVHLRRLAAPPVGVYKEYSSASFRFRTPAK